MKEKITLLLHKETAPWSHVSSSFLHSGPEQIFSFSVCNLPSLFSWGSFLPTCHPNRHSACVHLPPFCTIFWPGLLSLALGRAGHNLLLEMCPHFSSGPSPFSFSLLHRWFLLSLLCWPLLTSWSPVSEVQSLGLPSVYSQSPLLWYP